MQYYNGSMYGCSGDSYSGGHRPGLHRADRLPEQGAGLVQGTTIKVPYDKQVPGSARPVGRRWRRNITEPGLPGVAALRHRPQGPDDLVDQLDGSKNWTFGDNVKALQGR